MLDRYGYKTNDIFRISLQFGIGFGNKPIVTAYIAPLVVVNSPHCLDATI